MAEETILGLEYSKLIVLCVSIFFVAFLFGGFIFRDHLYRVIDEEKNLNLSFNSCLANYSEIQQQLNQSVNMTDLLQYLQNLCARNDTMVVQKGNWTGTFTCTGSYDTALKVK